MSAHDIAIVRASRQPLRIKRALDCLAFSLMVLSSCATAGARQISFPRPDIETSVSVSSNQVTRWRVGDYEVLHLMGDVRIQQQPIEATADEAILWVETPNGSSGGEHKVITYLEGHVVVDIRNSSDRIVDEAWLGRFFTRGTVDLDRDARAPSGDAPPSIFGRAQAALENGSQSSAQQTGFVAQQSVVVSPQTGLIQQVTPTFQTPQIGTPQAIQAGQVLPSANPGLSTGSPFNIQISRRDSSIDLNLRSFTNPNNPNERVSTGVGGIRIVVDSPVIANAPQFLGDEDRKLYIVADNMVQWQTVLPDGSKRDQFYLEGNVIFAKGSRVIYSERMFYDVDAQQGTILKAEITTTVPNYVGAVRLKANVVQQYDENNLRAFGSAMTTSRMGVPRYWLQSGSVGLQRTQVPARDPDSFASILDPQSGLYQTQDEITVDSQQNRVYFGGVPVFAWPRLKTSLNDPTLYLAGLEVNQDRIFGFQLKTKWNLYQLLGWKAPADTEWIGVLDYLSERGVGVGSEYDYQRDCFLGMPGKTIGRYESWFINDSGFDTLGLDRIDLFPEETQRGRIRLQHLQRLSSGYTLRAELGYISDRNFLEQYYEQEWDTDKDQATGIWLQNNVGTRSNNLTLDAHLNKFFAQTSGGRFDQFVLGQPVFNNRAIWHGHSQAGYVRMRAANEPLNPSEIAKFNPLPWEADVEGFRFGTRQEIDFPKQIGPAKVVPYLLGDATYWEKDLAGDDLTRVYGQAGIRASIATWRVDPSIQSVLWNVNGLAHKVTFDVDAFYADASQDLADLPLYDQIDDDSQEHFRRRFTTNTFGLPLGADVPLRYDERFFAMRSGMQGNVTAPSTEIADDLAAVKFGVRQRWQTKRGMPGRERNIDWITLDLQTIFYPDASRDNFGADFGMFDYDFQWFVGDRFSFVSDGYFDFFSQGVRTASFGTKIGRPEVGNAYVGYRMIEGPISSNILSGSLVYRMSDKWGVTAGGEVDFGATGTIGQSLSFIYIGESFLWRFGANYDVSRDNLGFRFGFEPRFIAKSGLFRPGGVSILPAGSRWLE